MIRSLRFRFFVLVWPLVVIALVLLGSLLGRWTVVELDRVSAVFEHDRAVRDVTGELADSLAIIGGSPQRFRPYVDLYLKSLEEFGHPVQPIAVHSPGHIAETDEQAREELWPHYQAMIARIGAERGWPPPTRQQFDRETGPGGALCVGSPETVAAKIIRTAQALDLSRFNMKYSHGTLPHDTAMRSIELFGTKVAPRVREEAGTVRPYESLRPR